ncbi:hypothetical protein [Tellurirhabdus bombi]|uniref:hypothetical protein n=1 Tax=Tellurirhabdus bombi TaxID=2907205 RepID=UPI001F3F43D4|nr:hypothetical protein [Tellurirhabdus bombi]
MATPLSQYVVELENAGYSGWVAYREPALALRFAYERSLNSAYIYIPGDDQWASYCRSAGAKPAAERRAEILQRIATEVKKLQTAAAVVQINDFGIELLF